MRKLVNGRGVEPSDPNNIYGKLVDGQSYVDEFLFDILYSVQHLASQTGIVQNGNRDNLNNGFQIFEALKALSTQSTMQYRGDVASPDFELSDLTLDGSSKTLDLSSIVPPKSKTVILRIEVDADFTIALAGVSIKFAMENAETNINRSLVNVERMPDNNLGQSVGFDVTVFLDDDLKISYAGNEIGDGLNELNITVGGWSF